MNWDRHGGSTTFETKSSYCRVARQGLPCYTAVARLGFKRRATAVPKSNLIRSTETNWVRHGSSTTSETGLSCPTKFYISMVFKFSWYGCNTPGEIKNKGCAKIGGANKVHHERCASGVYHFDRRVRGWTSGWSLSV